MASAISKNSNAKIDIHGESPPGVIKQTVNNLGDISFDATFIAAQTASIIANQLGKGYIEVIVINVSLLLAVKLIISLIKKSEGKFNL